MTSSLYLSTAYWAPISYFSAIYCHGGAVIEQCDTYIKQTYRNRCHIVGAQGMQALTIPVIKPSYPNMKVQDIRISDHGNWQHLHRNAIASAYGSSPFYEYYADDINHLYEQSFEFLIDFNMAQIDCVCNWLDISLDIQRSQQYISNPCNTIDLREVIHPKHAASHLLIDYLPRPYYQVFATRHGFIADVSILDLMCNMGNEALLILAHQI